MLISAAVFPANSCRKIESEDKEEEKEVLISRMLYLENDKTKVQHLDIFIYNDREILERHERFDTARMPLVLEHSKEARTLIAVGNCPYKFNINALSKLSSFSKLSFDFKDDRTEFPIMAARLDFDENAEDSIRIEMEALMCHVELYAVSCNLEDYELLESPRIRLKNMNASALIFQEKEYVPSEFIDYGEWSSLPYDIGMFTQYPGIRLAAYPNESGDDNENPFPTLLEFECRIKGEKHSFEFPVESLERNSVLKLGIEISGPDDYSSKVY